MNIRNLFPVSIWLSVILIIGGCITAPNPYPGENPPGSYTPGEPASSLEEFEAILETIRKSLNIPGMSACILHNGDIVWSRGFGFARLEGNVPALPETKYHLASLTKPFSAVVIMQLVEESLLGLDDRVADYGIILPNSDRVTVRHLLTHTSEGVPGSHFRYNGGRYALLGDVMAACTGRTYCDLLRERITVPLHLGSTAPDPRIETNCFFRTPGEAEQFAEGMAQGYDPSGNRPLNEPLHFSASAGLVSSVLDLAEFSRALDGDTLLTAENRGAMFTPAVLLNGSDSEYGFGWFIDHQDGVKICWVYGYWDAHSGLWLKIPSAGLDFIILANNNMLSQASIGIGRDRDVTRSFVAVEFLNAFVFGSASLPVFTGKSAVLVCPVFNPGEGYCRRCR